MQTNTTSSATRSRANPSVGAGSIVATGAGRIDQDQISMPPHRQTARRDHVRAIARTIRTARLRHDINLDPVLTDLRRPALGQHCVACSAVTRHLRRSA